MNMITEKIALFGPSDLTAFAVDAVQFNVSLRRLPPGADPRRLMPSREALAALKAKETNRRGGREVAAFRRGGLDLLQNLGHLHRGDGSVACLARCSVLRRLRARLTAEGRYTPELVKPDRARDNYLEPSLVESATDVHHESLVELLALVAEVRAVYVEVVGLVFGFTVPAADVVVNVAQIELTWDKPCVVARAVPTMFWRAWRDAFWGAARNIGFLDDYGQPVIRETDATKREQVGAAPASVVLRADGKKGGGAKLYVKHDRLVRFEAEFTNRRALKVLRHSIRLKSREQLAADLEGLAEAPFRALLVAQESAISDEMVSAPAVFEGFMEAGSRNKVLPIFTAFCAQTKFHNAGEEYSRALGILAKRGWARHLGRGYWAAAGPLARWMRRVPDLQPARGETR